MNQTLTFVAAQSPETLANLSELTDMLQGQSQEALNVSEVE